MSLLSPSPFFLFHPFRHSILSRSRTVSPKEPKCSDEEDKKKKGKRRKTKRDKRTNEKSREARKTVSETHLIQRRPPPLSPVLSVASRTNEVKRHQRRKQNARTQISSSPSRGTKSLGRGLTFHPDFSHPLGILTFFHGRKEVANQVRGMPRSVRKRISRHSFFVLLFHYHCFLIVLCLPIFLHFVVSFVFTGVSGAFFRGRYLKEVSARLRLQVLLFVFVIISCATAGGHCKYTPSMSERGSMVWAPINSRKGSQHCLPKSTGPLCFCGGRTNGERTVLPLRRHCISHVWVGMLPPIAIFFIAGFPFRLLFFGSGTKWPE